MPRPKLPHVVAERTRHGRVNYYYRKGARRIRLPDNFGTPTFLAAVELARSGQSLPRPLIRYTFDKSLKGNLGHTIRRALRGAGERARAKGLPFDLDFQWVAHRIERQDFRCALSGIAFFCDRSRIGTRNPYAPSLDRIDCAKGYTRDNVRVVLYALNVMLSDWGLEVVQRIANGCRRRANKISTSIPAPMVHIPAP